MKLVVFIIILGLIAIIPNGIWISIGVFLIWFLYRLKNFDGIQIEIVKQKNQDEYDDKILDQMK